MHAISFCDCMELSTEAFFFQYEIESIYCGSYFCDRYFVNIPHTYWMNIASLAKQNNVKIVLVVPIPGQSLLDAVKIQVQELIDQYPIAEIVVNDYSLFAWLSNLNISQALWYGRLLSKDIRDPRYNLKPTQIKLHARASQEGVWGYHPYGVEADLTEPVVSISNLQTCRLALHTPLAYLTTGRICEFASIGTELRQKFRPGMVCQMQCVSNYITYRCNDVEYFKLGRAVYTNSTEIPEEWKSLPIRLIHALIIRRM